jgi:hypothetical protein
LGTRKEFLGAIRFEYHLAILLILLSLLVSFRNKISLNCPLTAYAALLIFFMIVQIPLSVDVNLSWFVFKERLLKNIIIGYFIVVFIRSPKHLKMFLAAYLLAFMKIGQEGLLGKITGSKMWENQGVMRLHGTTGIYEHPNSFSGYAITKLPFLYYLMPLSPKIVKIFLIIGFLFALNIIIFTGSRTGYVALIIFLFFIFKNSKYKKRLLMAFSIIILICGTLFLGQLKPYLDRFESIYTMQEKEGSSAQKRIQIIKDSWDIFLENPFGVGLYAFRRVRVQKFGRDQDTHNLYLGIATNLGIQGLVAFFLFIFFLFKTLKLLKKNIFDQIKSLSGKIEAGDLSIEDRESCTKHLADLKLMHAVCNCVYLYTILRLVLGLFGMDLYDIYWWYSTGLTISIFNMNKISDLKTRQYLKHSS